MLSAGENNEERFCLTRNYFDPCF